MFKNFLENVNRGYPLRMPDICFYHKEMFLRKRSTLFVKI
jgi:hypothetical protein